MKIVTAVFCLLLCSPLFATDRRTAGDLFEKCKINVGLNGVSSPTDVYKGGICVGYVNGWLDSTSDNVFDTSNGPGVIQFEDGVNVGQIERVFVQFMEKHPELENKLAAPVLTKAVQEAHITHVRAVPPEPAQH